MRYQAVFFDLDGTLLDTSEGIIKAIEYIVNQFDLPELEEKEKLAFIGPPIQNSLQKRYGLSATKAWEIASAWRDIYKDKFLLMAKPYDGMLIVLRRIRDCGIKIGIATNKREDYAVKLLEHFQFLPLLHCVVGTDFQGKRSKSEIIHLCRERVDVNEPACCLMVGDTLSDLTAAKSAGVPFVGVTWGFGFSDREKKSKQVRSLVRNSEELMAYILSDTK